MTGIEAVGKGFRLELLMRSQKLTKEVVLEVSHQVFIGMSEKDGFDLIDQALKKRNTERLWHPHKFRIGPNTMKAFREKSDDSVRLQSNDLFFIDIGPVFNGHEGDYGETFLFGTNDKLELLKNASQEIFKNCHEQFKINGLKGSELYEFAKSKAHDLGFRLNEAMYGHRIGDFPHALHHRGSLGHYKERPCHDLWVLEILISDHQSARGSFYEDVI